MEIFAIGMIFTFIVIVATFCCIDLIEKMREKRFYRKLQVGDLFADPYYYDNPFQQEVKMLKIMDKKNDYILYEILWYDRDKKTYINRDSQFGSRKFHLFYIDFKDYKMNPTHE